MIEEGFDHWLWRTLTFPPPPQYLQPARWRCDRHVPWNDTPKEGAKLADPCHPPPPVPTSTIIFFTPERGGNRKRNEKLVQITD